MQYDRAVILVNRKDWKELQKKLSKKTKEFPKGQSLSSWVREKTKQFLEEK